MSWKELLSLTVLGACVTTMGSLVAMMIKEFIAVQWLESLRAKNTLKTVYRRYQIPIFLAAEELSGRLYGLSRDNNDRDERKVGIDQLHTRPLRELNIAVSDHYLRYRYFSNIYRLCSFLGWVELYRRDIGTLDTDKIDKNRELDICLRKVQGVLADGWINQHKDWKQWKDCLLYREEQRAIGSAMALPGDGLQIADFGRFTATIENDPKGESGAKWLIEAAHFFEIVEREKDFRIVRMKMLVVYLTELMEMLQPGRLDRSHISTSNVYRSSLEGLTGGSSWAATPLPRGALPVHRTTVDLPY